MSRSKKPDGGLSYQPSQADRLLMFTLRYLTSQAAYARIVAASGSKPISEWRRHMQPYFPHVDLHNLKISDAIRIPLQLIWLVCIKSPQEKRQERRMQKQWGEIVNLNSQRTRREIPSSLHSFIETLSSYRLFHLPIIRYCIGLLTVILCWFCITTPLSFEAQMLFVLLLYLAAMFVRLYEGQVAGLVLIVLSVIATSRYLWWRYTSTLNWDNTLDWTFGLGLLAAETYACTIMFLGYFQTAWPLSRGVKALPDNLDQWPTVDIFIPTYNEPLKVVKPTVYASMAIDWPKEKLNIYLLDDGDREEMQLFAAQCGVKYRAREGNSHAKAGNLNEALEVSDGHFIAIFDCDHIPTRSFLQTTMGWFLKDDKLALVQTPHHFFSPDPFEQNLNNFRTNPNENELFYGLCQDGNDLWDAVFFCGSCAIMRREPLLEVGGVAIETVTEDAHTALKLHRAGYSSIYLKVPQAAGLATESLSAHIGQRVRWARGMTQVFRLDNPMLGKGLKFAQRLCYTNAMLHFLYGLPRIVFLTAPLAFLLFEAHIIYASALMIVIYVLPHLIHSGIANSRMQGDYRRSFWAELYETVLAWYILWPTMVALVAPNRGAFNVTAKGGLKDKEFFDWQASKPYLVLVAMNLTGLCFGLSYLIIGSDLEESTIILNLVWTIFNLTILGGAIAVAEEARQVRHSHRIPVAMPAIFKSRKGVLRQCEVVDYSDSGLGLYLPDISDAVVGDEMAIILSLGQNEYQFPAKIINCSHQRVGIRFDVMSREQEQCLIQCTFGRADAWIKWNDERDSDAPIKSLFDIFSIGLKGYGILIHHSFTLFEGLFLFFIRMIRSIVGLLPRQPGRKDRVHHV